MPKRSAEEIMRWKHEHGLITDEAYSHWTDYQTNLKQTVEKRKAEGKPIGRENYWKERREAIKKRRTHEQERVRTQEAVDAYHEKNGYMDERYRRISALELYQAIFPPDRLESYGRPGYRAPNPIFTLKSERVREEGERKIKMPSYLPFDEEDAKKDKDKSFFINQIVFGDNFEESVEMTQGNPCALCSMMSYSGRSKTARAAYQCHGFIIDLDGVRMDEIESFWGWVYHLEKIPCPTFVANSGQGLHIYYQFQNPVPLYPGTTERLQNLKRGLTEWVWNRETSREGPQKRQYQGIYQAFRMVGSQTKIIGPSGQERLMVTAWRTGNPVTIEYLNGFVDKEYRAPDSPDFSSWDWRYGEGHYSLSECKEMFPDWYQRRIVEHMAPAQWTCSIGLYEWWLGQIQKGARDGTRYFCIAYLYVYAIKCGVPQEIADADAEALIEPFNELTEKPHNEFTYDDVWAASKFYSNEYARTTKRLIEYRTHITMPHTRRNGRTQEQHLLRARAVRDAVHENWREGGGRPDKKDIVRAWREEHPNGKKIDCERETGLSRHTVLKWWEN